MSIYSQSNYNELDRREASNGAVPKTYLAMAQIAGLERDVPYLCIRSLPGTDVVRQHTTGRNQLSKPPTKYEKGRKGFSEGSDKRTEEWKSHLSIS